MTKLVFLGNCQARRLQVFYDEHFSPVTGITTGFVASYGHLTPDVLQLLTEADIVVAQLADTEQKVSLRKIETKAKVIEFPYVTGMFLWPFSGRPHVYNKPLPCMHDGPYGMLLGNLWLDKKIKSGARPEDIVAEYAALDLSKMVNLSRTFELSIAAARQRDERTGFGLAAFIENSLTETPLFMTPGSFERPLFRPLAMGVYEQLGISSTAVNSALDSLWRSPFPIADLPIHPSVARHFGLKFIDADTRYRTITGERLAFDEWISRYVRYEWNNDLLEGIHRVSSVRRFDAAAQPVLDQLDAGLAASNGSAIGQIRRAHLLKLKGDHEGALRATFAAAVFDPQDPQILGTLAIYLAERSAFDEAVQVAEGVTRVWPHYADGWSRLGNVLSRRGSLAEAIVAARRAVELAPRNVEYNKHLASMLLQAGEGEQARSVLSGIIAMLPERAELQGTLSRMLMQLGDLDGALIAARQAVLLEPGRAEWHSHLSDVLIRRGDLVSASVVLREAMTLDPAQASLCIALAKLQLQLGRRDEAIAQFRRAIELEPANVHLHTQLADTLQASGDVAASEQAYRAALALDPSHNAARGSLALLVARQGRADEGLAVIEEAVARTPADPHLLAKQSFLLSQTGNFVRARETAERAVAVAPQLAGVHATLADVMERQRDLVGALEEYRTAARLDGKNLHFRRQVERLSRRSYAEADAAE
jgi:Flp pilus assembly protein TadD